MNPPPPHNLAQGAERHFDATLGYPGEGPALKGLALPTILTINPNSGNSLLEFLDKARPDDHVILAQEMKIPNETKNGENLIDVFREKSQAKRVQNCDFALHSHESRGA
jgi:hypothetical protein